MEPEAHGNLGIRYVTAEPTTWWDYVRIPGLVVMDPDRQAMVSAPSTVRILELDAPPHASVRPGQRLALLELVDSEVRNLQIRAVDVRADLMAARTGLERERAYLASLESSGAAPDEHRRVARDVDVLAARVQALESSMEAVLKALGSAGLSQRQLSALDEEGATVTRVAVHAPKIGAVSEMEVAVRPVVVGQTVPAGEPLFELVALDRLLVLGEAFEADLPAVRAAVRGGLPVAVEFPGEGRTISGLRIHAVEGALDGEDRTVHFFVNLPNSSVGESTEGGARFLDWENQAGARVQVLVATEEGGERFVIPSTALVREGTGAWVYRRHEDHCQRVAVKVDTVRGRDVVIPLDGGLAPGDQVVVAGALQLHLAHKSGEGAVDPHAGHNH